MLDRAKFEGTYDASEEFDWQALTAIELRLITLFRRMAELDRQRLLRMSEVLSEIPDSSQIDHFLT